MLGRRRKIERLRLGERCGSGGAREKDAAKMAALRESAGTIYRAPTNLRQAGRCGERGGGPGPFVPQGELKSGALHRAARARHAVPLQMRSERFTTTIRRSLLEKDD